MNTEKDALLATAIQTVEQLEALVFMLQNLNGVEDTHATVADELRSLADLLDQLPTFESDLRNIKIALRGMLSSDPDKTPRAFKLPRRTEPG